MSVKPLRFVDLFCGAGGSATGLARAAAAAQRGFTLDAFNHSQFAVETLKRNHPWATVHCVNLDAVRPSDIVRDGVIDGFWASPSCGPHSSGRSGRPIDDQQRSSAWCVVRWLESTKPAVAWIENVRQFMDWAPLDDEDQPIPALKGEIFRAWITAIRSLGYTVEWRMLNCADYGEPQARIRLIVQAVRGGRKIVWPEPTHSPVGGGLFKLQRHRTAREIIDWTNPGTPVFQRAKPLCKNTMRRILDGWERFGAAEFQPFIVAWDNTSTKRGDWSIDQPLTTVVTKARHGVATPFLVKYYGTGGAVSVDKPLDTVTTHDRFGLVQPRVKRAGKTYLVDFWYRVLTDREYARAQGFPDSYEFSGNTNADRVKQIGNAVPVRLAEALMRAQIEAEQL